MKNSINSVKRKWRLTFIVAVAGILLVTMIIIEVLKKILLSGGVLTEEMLDDSLWFAFILWNFASLLIGSAMALFVGKWVFGSGNLLMDGLARLSSGDYSVRLDFGKSENLKILSDAFNKLAVELQKTQILRSDFVNAFSHEFKTPISSINGLIGLMKRGKLTEEKRREYLDIIEEETNRLSTMTTNILNLTKIESQSILTDVTRFNLSEQLRTCVLLFEKKWSQKELSLSIDFEEYIVCGNEDMLKQVWINLLDNAIKFSLFKGELSVSLEQAEQELFIRISNDGAPIEEEERGRIFQKFYQSGKESDRQGNGIGLSIVKHVVELHRGRVFVDCENGKTSFTVVLPKNMNDM